MNSETLLNQWIAGLSSTQRIQALAFISQYLTICAREYQPGHTLDDKTIIKKLLGISELQHKIADEIISYNGGNSGVFPPDVLSKVFFEIAAQYEVTYFLDAAIGFAKSRKSSAV